jgi:hypothetical protein
MARMSTLTRLIAIAALTTFAAGCATGNSARSDDYAPRASGAHAIHSAEAVPAPAPAPHAQRVIRNDCPEPVRLYVGERPTGDGAGAVTLRPAEIRELPLPAGAKVWILNTADEGVSAATVQESTRRLVITPLCRNWFVE